jgi:phosphoribosylformimino-5-aminoimidazole carboxamide ribotide isomerase
MKIIPAIDVLGGKCVRLSEGNFNTSRTYYDDPVEVAKLFESHGIKHLHLVDLDGARAGHVINLSILEHITKETNMLVDVGGGIQSDIDIRRVFDAGASQVTAGSIVIKNEALFLSWLEQYGADKIILGADCKDGKIVTNGWTKTSTFPIIDYIQKYSRWGISRIISTDISKDGMLKGPSFDLYNSILNECNINVIASGGIATMQDLHQLRQLGCEGAIIGKAIYERTISLKQLSGLC